MILKTFLILFLLKNVVFSDVVYKENSDKNYNLSQRKSAEGERGDRAYDSRHEVENGEKGQHKEERHRKHYNENAGKESSHNQDDNYYDLKKKSQKGQRGLNYSEKGSYAKGHNTKGRHNVHKLNEFKKVTNFNDENHDKAYKENHGGYEIEKLFKAGEGEKFRKKNSEFLKGKFGKSGEFDKGKESVDIKGFVKDEGKDGFYKNFEKLSGKSQGVEFGEYKDVDV